MNFQRDTKIGRSEEGQFLCNFKCTFVHVKHSSYVAHSFSISSIASPYFLTIYYIVDDLFYYHPLLTFTSKSQMARNCFSFKYFFVILLTFFSIFHSIHRSFKLFTSFNLYSVSIIVISEFSIHLSISRMLGEDLQPLDRLYR